MSLSFVQNLILSDSENVWSYSRIKKYGDCKYAWYLKYVEDVETEDLFFSQFGSFIHKIYSLILLGDLTKEEALSYYLVNFRTEVNAKAPSENIFNSYFKDGLRLMKETDQFLSEVSNYEVVGVELPVDFKIGGNLFTGFIDCLLKDGDGNLIVVDHKSRKLKPRSKKGTLKSDAELEEYLKQLYLYSDAVKEIYGTYPTELWFNCFRNENSLIKEKFDIEKLVDTKTWAMETIWDIQNTTNWTPNCDWFACTNLCECHRECEYYNTMKS